MGEVQPQGEVYSDAAAAAAGDVEGDVEDAEAPGDLDRPSEEDVCDDAGGAAGEAGEEAVEGGLEGLGGLEERDEERKGQGVGVLGVGREAVIWSVEGREERRMVVFAGRVARMEEMLCRVLTRVMEKS